MRKTTDRDVRNALKLKVISEHVSNPNTLVVEELGLDRGACRVDVAVVNGLLHGYEIKSDADTLVRLPSQVELYSRVLDKATLVVGEHHVNRARPLIRDWWGIRVVTVGARNALSFSLERPAAMNPQLDAVLVAQLLWRDELCEFLAELGGNRKDLRETRSTMAKRVAEMAPLSILRARVRECLKRRTVWRHREQLEPSDG